jgi:hypothetical protein
MHTPTPETPSPEPATTRSRACRRWTRVLGFVAVATLGATVAWAASSAWSRWAASAAIARYEPRKGDVIFQSLPHGPVVWAIEGVTRSPYSHCGIVGREDGQWVVYEAIGRVRVTPLREYLERGRGGGFAAYRLRDEFAGHIPATLECCRTYLGRPYDIRYRLDDEKIYCSELIYKAFRDATQGQELGTLSRFGDMDWGAYEALIRQIEGGPIPVDRMMITPVGLARAPQLVPIFWHNLAVEAR